MKNIKKFAKSLIELMLIGAGVAFFGTFVMSLVFDLEDRFAMVVTTTILGATLPSLWWIFNEARKKKSEKK